MLLLYCRATYFVLYFNNPQCIPQMTCPSVSLHAGLFSINYMQKAGQKHHKRLERTKVTVFIGYDKNYPWFYSEYLKALQMNQLLTANSLFISPKSKASSAPKRHKRGSLKKIRVNPL